MPRPYRYLFFAILFAGIGLVSWDLGRNWARAYERMQIERIANGLEVLELDWVRVQASGLRVNLHGHAPDLFAQELAVESARATAPLAVVNNYMTASLAPPQSRDPIRIELHRDSEGATLTGQFAGAEMRALLTDLLRHDAPDVTIRDLTGIQARRPPPGWGPELGIAALAAAALPNAWVVIEPGRVRVEGQAPDGAARSDLEAKLAALGGDTVIVDQAIRVPLDVITPFTFAAVREISGALRLEHCAVRTRAERSVIAELLASRGVQVSDATCPVGLGGPLDDWTGAIAAGLDALDRLPAGRFELEYRTATLTAHPPTSPTDFTAVRETFTAATPAGFAATGEILGDDAAAKVDIERGRHWLRFTTGEDGLVMAGTTPDATAQGVIGTYANALFGADRVSGRLGRIGAAAPVDWQRYAMAALDVLKTIRPAEIEIGGRRMMLRATVESPAEAAALDARMREAAGDYALTTAITVDLAAAWARIPLPGPQCADALNRVVLERPVEFDPGSAVIAEDSAPVLDRLAEVLARCDGNPIEIGGHTDSDGSTGFNERLSRARAAAVLQALALTGIPAEVLVAKGYGESEPIASNETETGRAANRRIEFRAMP